MTIDQITIFAIIIVTFSLFIWGKWRYDIVSIIALCLLFISDIILGGEQSALITDPASIFLGFGHTAVITVAAVLIISRALRNSGVVDLISRKISPFSNYQLAHITSLSSVAALFSAIMNNVGALALMLPVALKTSMKQNRSPSVILMPMAFASILGGMITMIGTPPNIIISSLRESHYLELKDQAMIDKEIIDEKIKSLGLEVSEDEIYEFLLNTPPLDFQAAKYLISQNINIDQFTPEPFSMLDFSPVGGSIALMGIFFVAFIGWRFIPKGMHKKAGTESMFSMDEYMTEIRIPESCKFIGKKTGDIESYTEERLTIISGISSDEGIYTPQNNQVIQAEDRYLVKADPVDLKLMMDEYDLRLNKKMRERIDMLKDEDTTFKEVLITPDSLLVGRDRRFFRRRTSDTLILMAVSRQNQPIQKRLGEVIFKVGDVLLIQGNRDNLNDNIVSLNLVPLAERDVQVGVFSKVALALFIFGTSIALSVAGILPTTLAFVMAILMYVFTGILPVRDLYQQIDWSIIVLLGAMIPISNALQTTGSTQIIADLMVSMTQNLPSWSILVIIMVITMCLSDIINNAATALIMAPISVGIAVSMGVSMDPFLMAVAVGASCAFLTPIGHQCNALILGPGGYRFSDYWRMGLPLEILIVIVGTPLILHFWPL